MTDLKAMRYLLVWSFPWQDTEEGHNYWQGVAENLWLNNEQ